jgi:4-hydroxybenzoate polyprenyltransferase
MILMRYAVIEPLLSKMTVFLVSNPGTEVSLELQSPWYDFIILIIATLLITAGGYVINDYFDIKTDLINKGEVIVGTKIPRRKAMLWHNFLNIAGVIAGFYISWKAGYFWMGLLFLVVSGLLYFYSASYKRQFLIGNMIVALLTALVPMLVALYEWPALYKFYAANSVSSPDLKIVFYWIGGFSIFAFLTTLVREIIKDIEDFEGDHAYGRNTVPVVTGILTAKIISILLIAITVTLLYIIWYFFLNDKITLVYLSAGVVLPLIFVIIQVIISSERKQLHLASRMMKIVMIAGVLYSVVVKVILDQNLV